MEDLIEEFINQRVWAVVGASEDPAKYGNRIFRDLREAGYTVYQVNPRRGEIEGQTLYPALSDLPERPAVGHSGASNGHRGDRASMCAVGSEEGMDATRQRVGSGHPFLPGARHKSGS